MSEEKKNTWFQALYDKINMLAEQFGLDEMQRHAFRDFVVTTAREQYKTGNRSGAGWAFAQARKGQSEQVVST
ncbi:MAG: hypothetical protein HQ488_01270 [Parcubacteria group bacterium]|nr:hypothetical protein [Parcubacteria group bacterium]